MRPPCKTIRPAPEAVTAVQEHMRKARFWTTADANLWFETEDTVLDPINATRAAQALLKHLHSGGLILKLVDTYGQHQGRWEWRGTAEERAATQAAHRERWDLNSHSIPAARPESLERYGCGLKWLSDEG
jgi:hypothetical protein